VFVVASARDDFDPAAVLFESEGVRRDTAPSREERKEVTECAGTLTANGGGLNRPAGNANELDFCVTASRMVAFDGYNQTLSDTSQTIRADKSDGDHIGMVMHPMAFDTTQITSPYNYSNPQAGDPCHPLAAGAHPPAVAQPIPIHDQAMHQGGVAIVSPTWTASNDPSRSPQSTEVTNQVAAIHAVSMAVRRLTPTECERLQGFPDGYTNIPWRKKPESPDGPRYKSLGNSWAVPVVAWIGRRIEGHLS
jgi:DNA (cytosine-5)-methyltransferase 1